MDKPGIELRDRLGTVSASLPGANHADLTFEAHEPGIAARAARDWRSGERAGPRRAKGPYRYQGACNPLIATAASLVFHYVTKLPPAEPATIAAWLRWVFEGSGDLPRCLRKCLHGDRRVAAARCALAAAAAGRRLAAP